MTRKQEEKKKEGQYSSPALMLQQEKMCKNDGRRECMHTLLTSARFKTQSATSCGCFFKGEAIMVNQKFARRPLATTALKGLDKGLQRLELSLLNDGYANQLLSFLETLLFLLIFRRG